MKIMYHAFCGSSQYRDKAISRVFEKFVAILVFAIFFALLFEPRNVCSEEPTNTIAQVKTFLEHPPAIQNVVFGQPYKETTDNTGIHSEETLHGASIQGDSFVVAALKTPDEIPQMTTRTLPIAGKDHSFRWSIIGMTLNRGPTNRSEIDPNDPAVRLSEELEWTLDEPMNLGIFHATRGTLHVSENGDFDGPLAKRITNWEKNTKIEGKFSFSPKGLLDGAVWHTTFDPGFIFHIKYFYNDKKQFPPSSWVTWAIRDGKDAGTNYTEIFKFEVATSELSESVFLPERFMVNNKTNLPSIGSIVLTQSNGQTLWLQNGKFQKTDIKKSFFGGSDTRSHWIFRIILGVFALGGIVIIIWSALANARRRK